MLIGDTTEQMNRSFRYQYDTNMLSKFPEILKMTFPKFLRKPPCTELGYDTDTEMLKNQLDVMRGEFGELNQYMCSDAAHRCRMPGPTGREEDKRELMTPTSTFYIMTVCFVEKTRNSAIDRNIGHLDNEFDIDGLESLEGTKVGNIKPQVGRFVFPDGPGVIVLASCRLLTVVFSLQSLSAQFLPFLVEKRREPVAGS